MFLKINNSAKEYEAMVQSNSDNGIVSRATDVEPYPPELESAIESLHNSTPVTSEPDTETDTTEEEEVTEASLSYDTYELTDSEIDLIARVICAEARGESAVGQMAIAQCIRDAAEYFNIRPAEVITSLQYATPGSGYSDSEMNVAKDAVYRVFTQGSRPINSRVIYFYAPDMCYSEFHESQVYVTTIGGHKFFDIKEN